MTFSVANSGSHGQYREYFDKPCGVHQYNSPLKYVYKTPSNGTRDFDFYAAKSSYYWDKRIPVDPRSIRASSQLNREQGFQPDWQVAASKNNPYRYPTQREYFDMPIEYIPKGY